MLESLWPAVLIFCLRCIDVSLGTMRMILTIQGRRTTSALLGFIEVSVFITAVASVAQGASPTEADVIATVKEQLASYKAPKRVIFVGEVPRAPNGKADYRTARQLATDATFGDFAKFQSAFNNAAATRFGSGWAWLVLDNGKLAVITGANADTPIAHDLIPLFTVDVWEHAYYLKYQNKRPDYIDGWLEVVDWAKASERFAAATA